MCWRYSSKRGGADRAQLAARQHRLQHVAGVHRTFGGARPHQRVQLVDERDDLAFAVDDLLQHGLHALLELAAVLRPGDHRPEIERDQPLVLQRFGNVAVDDALREPLDDGGLAHARLADQHRVVLGAARQHLDRPADLLVTPDHGVELAAARGLGEVAAVLLERLEGVLRVLVGDPLAPSHLRERAQDRIAGEARFQQDLSGAVIAARDHREQQVLGRDVLVGQGLGLGGGGLEQPGGGRRDPRLGRRAGVHLRQRIERRRPRAHGAGRGSRRRGAAAGRRCPRHRRAARTARARVRSVGGCAPPPVAAPRRARSATSSSACSCPCRHHVLVAHCS